MNELEYFKKLNINTIVCYCIASAIVFISFVIDLPKGNAFVAFYMSAVLLAFGVSIIRIVHLYTKNPSSKKIKYVITAGYLVCYFCVILVSGNQMNYVYIFPMFCILLVYCDIRLIGFTCLITLLVNTLAILFRDIGFQPVEGSTFSRMFTQVSTILLSAGLCNRAVKLLSIKDEIFSDALDTRYEDSLTGLKNVRFIDESRTSRFDVKRNQRFNIAFIDIDDFKSFNTQYGHSVGDLVLKNLAMVFMKNIGDIPHTYAIRNGGDEFLIISRTLKTSAFESLIEKCRRDISETQYSFLQMDARITISVGISSKEVDTHCKTFQELYDVADRRNRIAKSSGKNMIVRDD